MRPSFTRNIDVVVQPTPDELASVFWGMSGGDQALFFNRLGELSGHMLCFQLQAVTDSILLNQQGRNAMMVIGEYSEGNHD